MRIPRLHYKVSLIIILLLPLFVPLNEFTLFSQDSECTAKLVRAEEEYHVGNFSAAVDLIKPCLTSNQLNEDEKGRAYRLLGLVYIAQELEKDANEAVKNLLIMVPKYKIDKDKDPPQLQEIIDTVSKNLIPKISSITPNSANSGEPKVLLKVKGENFVYGSYIRFNNVDKKTNYISTNELETELTSTDISRQGEFNINVYSPILEGKNSNTVKFKVSSQRLNFSIHGMLPVPLGDFAADKGNEGDGFASIGYGIMAELNFPVNTTGLGWISGVGYFYNGRSSSATEVYLKDLGVEYTSENGSYSNVPIMTGLSYSGDFSPGLGYTINGQIIYSLVSAGDESYEYSGYITIEGFDYHLSFIEEYKYESASSFGFGIGAGLIINDLIIISARYLSLGTPELKYDYNATIEDLDTNETVSLSESDKKKQSISYFTLSVGITF